MNYRNEGEHCAILIDLVRELDRLGRLDLVQRHLAPGVPALGGLVVARQRRDFDVELTFKDVSLVVEVKVDSDEGYRWNPPAQTERIVTQVQNMSQLAPAKQFLYVTLGTAEYYTSYNRYTFGPASPHFRHVRLEEILTFARDAVAAGVGGASVTEWIREMERELRVRAAARDLLARFWVFREAYLRTSRLDDFPNERYRMCMPELAFPVLGKLAAHWNSSARLRGQFGRVQVYPVGRAEPKVHDSVFNFWELWQNGPVLTCRGLVAGRIVYLEINEDFNLHLKVDGDASIAQEVRNFAASIPLNPPGVRRGGPCWYKRQTYVVYEWDLGLLEPGLTIVDLANRIAQAVEYVVQQLT